MEGARIYKIWTFISYRSKSCAVQSRTNRVWVEAGVGGGELKNLKIENLIFYILCTLISEAPLDFLYEE